ncbi:hypothetical protein DFJ74DRAFT_764472 [Hyaloraphidium curvatum]|nr:hypothetical protein DFJ74DRAFT_764472 [Hyaloraphidium curvatum]
MSWMPRALAAAGALLLLPAFLLLRPAAFALCGSGTGSPRGVGLVVLGDSVDRYIISDGCKARNAKLCAPPGWRNKGPRPDEEECGALRTLANSTVARELAPGLAPEFDFILCRDAPADVSVLLVHLRLASSPAVTSLCEANPLLGSSSSPEPPSPAELWRAILVPLFRALPAVLARPPTALLVQALYWDLYKAWKCRPATYALLHSDGPAGDACRGEWLAAHARNATALMRAAAEAAEEARWPLAWAGWRTSNPVGDTGLNETLFKWRWPRTNELVERANAGAARGATGLGMGVFRVGRPGLRDRVHPTPKEGSRLLGEVLGLVAGGGCGDPE